MQVAPYTGVSYRGMGDACFIKALFSPGIVLYQCKIQKKISFKSSFTNTNREMNPPKQVSIYSVF